jgi:hypothetical protein
VGEGGALFGARRVRGNPSAGDARHSEKSLLP